MLDTSDMVGNLTELTSRATNDPPGVSFSETRLR